MNEHTREISEALAIGARFALEGTPQRARLYGSGHIHDTFLLETDRPTGPRYILQHINQTVFTNVPVLMDNMAKVLRHLQTRLADVPGADPRRESLTLLPTHGGEPYFLDAAGEYWRVFLCIAGTRTYDRIDSPARAYAGGLTFGRFLCLLDDFPVHELRESIPAFHDIEKRLETFFHLVRSDPHDRRREIPAEVDFVARRAAEMPTILHLGRQGLIPLRVTHNDTKFNNLLFDEADRPVCVIDLDTVMPGYAPYDFGDAIRTGACTTLEDEKNLEAVRLDIELYSAYARGFLESAGPVLTPREISLLPFSAKLLTFMIGLRFLTDHLNGDTYFKIHYPGHNLQRARVQFRLLSSMEAQYATMKEIVAELAGGVTDAVPT